MSKRPKLCRAAGVIVAAIPLAALASAIEPDPPPPPVVMAAGPQAEAAELPPGFFPLDLVIEGLERQVADGGWPAVPALPEATLEPGGTDARMPGLRERLCASGHLAPEKVAEGEIYDPELVAAVVLFQEDLGLVADGRLGKRTLAALNVPAERRLLQARLNRERQLALAPRLETRYLLVNVPEAVLWLVEDGRTVMELRTVVGKRSSPTPVMSNRIRAAIFNPHWDIPPGITRREELPKIRRDPGYLAAEGIQVLTAGPGGTEVDPSTLDWSRNDVLRGLTLRQRPGPKNPLGEVKLMFPNEHFVYLHDTPGRGSFLRASRALSHGCVRVERALDLTELLLASTPTWDRAHIDAEVAKDQPVTVLLAEPVPVHLVYWTAWIDQSGRLRLRDDIYGWDVAPAALESLTIE